MIAKMLRPSTVIAGAMIAASSVALLGSPAQASQIYVQQSGTSPAGGDPNAINTNLAFVVGTAGNQDGSSPLLLIIGTYDGQGTPSLGYCSPYPNVPGCASPDTYASAGLASPGTYGLTAAKANFTTGNAFATLGLQDVGGSESFVNWSTNDATYNSGLATPTSFELYAFNIPVALTADKPLSLELSGAPVGSYVIAYTCDPDKGCANNGDVLQTVFTNSGLVDVTAPPVPTPEPASLAILGISLAGLGFVRLRRHNA